MTDSSVTSPSSTQRREICRCKTIGPEAEWILPLYRQRISCRCVDQNPSDSVRDGGAEAKAEELYVHAPETSPSLDSIRGMVAAHVLDELSGTNVPVPAQRSQIANLASMRAIQSVSQDITELPRPFPSSVQQLYFINCPGIVIQYLAPLHNHPENRVIDSSSGHVIANTSSGTLDMTAQHGARVLPSPHSQSQLSSNARSRSIIQ